MDRISKNRKTIIIAFLIGFLIGAILFSPIGGIATGLVAAAIVAN